MAGGVIALLTDLVLIAFLDYFVYHMMCVRVRNSGPILSKVTMHLIPCGKSKIGPSMVILILANIDNVAYFRYLTFYDGIIL